MSARCTCSSPARVDTLFCPCGLPARYATCCGRWHHGALRLQAPDAEQLMRSRYSAFVLGDHAYLLDTWHPLTRPDRIDPDPAGLRWLGLEVRRHAQEGQAHATVEFVARYKQGGRATRLHEISRFERIEGRWLYRDGVAGAARRPAP
jgi:SEC-C motif domain protein